VNTENAIKFVRKTNESRFYILVNNAFTLKGGLNEPLQLVKVGFTDKDIRARIKAYRFDADDNKKLTTPYKTMLNCWHKHDEKSNVKSAYH
jgi:hypothetical protein